MAEGRKEQRNHVNGHINGYSHNDQQAQQEQEKVMKHITSAFNHWKAVPEKQRQETWRLEVLRAYAREQDKQKVTTRLLEQAEQEVHQLRGQVDQLSKCQQPREFLLFPPTSVPIPQETIKELGKAGLDFAALDYDKLVDKWKLVIQRHRKSNPGMAAQKPLPDTTTTTLARTRNFSAPHSAAAAGGAMVNGHTSLRGPTTTTTSNNNNTATHDNHNVNDDVIADLDEDLEDADADGEGDEPDHHAPPSQPGPGPGRAPQAVMDRGVLDPSLRGHADGMVLDGMEGNGTGLDPEGFIHGQMLMGLSAGEFGGVLPMNVNGDKGVE